MQRSDESHANAPIQHGGVLSASDWGQLAFGEILVIENSIQETVC